MKSRYGSDFNHDDQAREYDAEVTNENDPIRKGYADLMSWVGGQMNAISRIVDLGCGTGNTALKLPVEAKILCVDLSIKMMAVAKEKLVQYPFIQFIQKDLLEFITAHEGTVDGVVSTYAIHHLIPSEKKILLNGLSRLLSTGGKAVFGDLMFLDKSYEKDMRKKYPELLQEFDEEYFWYVDEAQKILGKAGFDVEIRQFSDLSWGISAVKK